MTEVPQAPRRRTDVITRSIGDELVVLDRRSNHAHNLGELASAVFTRCDGNHTVEAIAGELGLDVSDVATALLALADADLLETGREFGRRSLLQLAGVVGATTVAGPALITILTPSAAAAGSAQSFTFTTPGTYTVPVPSGVTTLTLGLIGGSGGLDSQPSNTGRRGLGASLTAIYTIGGAITSSSTLTVVVGAAGGDGTLTAYDPGNPNNSVGPNGGVATGNGANGGNDVAGTPNSYGAGAGGASTELQLGSTRLAVAGGGGGAGSGGSDVDNTDARGGNGGDNGGGTINGGVTTPGGDGTPSAFVARRFDGTFGQGGQSGSGGAGGASSNGGRNVESGGNGTTAGAGGIGGDGNEAAGGGGGGGYTGGGGGGGDGNGSSGNDDGGGGGAGSSYCSVTYSLANANTTGDGSASLVFS